MGISRKSVSTWCYLRRRRDRAGDVERGAFGRGSSASAHVRHRSESETIRRDQSLPDAFIDEPDRLARFQREAEVLAALNHPNIAAIYGLERSSGITALVMELVEGPTLADRIADGPLPLDDALPIAAQIVEALDSAHDRGVVHRDLKSEHRSEAGRHGKGAGLRPRQGTRAGRPQAAMHRSCGGACQGEDADRRHVPPVRLAIGIP